MAQRLLSFLTYSLIALAVVFGRLLWMDGTQPESALRAQFYGEDPPTMLLFLALGGVAVLLTKEAGLPPVLPAISSCRELIRLPAGIGLGSGVLLVLWELIFAMRESPFVFTVQAISFYLSTAVILEITLHLIPVVLVARLPGKLILAGRWQQTITWLGILLIAGLEPALIFSATLFAIHGPGYVFSGFALLYAINLAQLVVFYRRGFLVTLLLRLVMVLTWLSLWGLIHSLG
jgi:hypothetical protein